MSNQQDGTTSAPAAPVPTGNVAGPQLIPPPQVAAKRSFKSKESTVKRSFAAGPSSTGLPQILNGMTNFSFFDQKQLAMNKYAPNSFAFHAILNLLCNAMIGHDRFLKAVRLWHPLTVFLFYSVVFYIQILRVQRAAGQIDTYHLTLLQGLEQMFPIDDIMIPGPLVPTLMALSTSAAPYEWFGDVMPRLPELADVTRTNKYVLRNHAHTSIDYLNYPSPIVFIDAIYRLAKGRLVRGTTHNNLPVLTPADLLGIGQVTPADAILAHDGDVAPFPLGFLLTFGTDRASQNVNVGGNIPLIPITNADNRRFLYNGPFAKLPLPESKRVNDQFFHAITEPVGYYQVEIQAAQPGPPPVPAVNMQLMQAQLNRFALDLPARPVNDAGTTGLLLEHFLGFTDLPDEEGAQIQVRTWFAQLIPDMTMFCRFIEDSRPLSAINLVGLGAPHIKWVLRPNPQLYLDQPVPAANDNELFRQRLQRIVVNNFTAHGTTADPTLEAVAERISALSMLNVDWNQIGGNAAADQGSARTGPFWNQPDMSTSQAFDLGPYLAAEIGKYVLPVAR